MGTILKLECSKCDYDETLNIGQGIRDNDPENFLGSFPDSVRSGIEHITGSGAIWTYEKMLAICSRCHRYTTVPAFRSLEDDGMEIYGMSECRHESSDCTVTGYDGFKTVLKCPKCNSQMAVSEIGIWD